MMVDPVAPADSSDSALRVLVVDDHASCAPVCAPSSPPTPPTSTVVGEADDVEGAVAAVHALAPDVVLLDVHLPGGSGGGGPRWWSPARTCRPRASSP